MSKNLFETYEVNGRQYTDNLPKNALISIPKEQYIEYEQQREEIERLNNIINELEKKLLELRLTDVDGKTIAYRLLDKLQELKGSDKE